MCFLLFSAHANCGKLPYRTVYFVSTGRSQIMPPPLLSGLLPIGMGDYVPFRVGDGEAAALGRRRG